MTEDKCYQGHGDIRRIKLRFKMWAIICPKRRSSIAHDIKIVIKLMIAKHEYTYNIYYWVSTQDTIIIMIIQ